MKTVIKKIHNKYYVFHYDCKGNVYDQMMTFKTRYEAVCFIKKYPLKLNKKG